MESMIVMTLMVIILGATHSFIRGGVDFYRSSIQNLEVQQQALVGLTKMADEMRNSSLDKIYVPPVPNNDAVVFPSRFKLDGTLSSNAKGVPLWNSIVCYAQKAMPDGTVVIERKVEAHAEVDYPPDPLTIIGGARDIPYFTTLPATGIIARRLAIPAATDPPSLTLVKSTDKITITLKVEFSQRTKDTMKVEAHVFPQG